MSGRTRPRASGIVAEIGRDRAQRRAHNADTGAGSAYGHPDLRPEWVDMEAVEIEPDDPRWPWNVNKHTHRVWVGAGGQKWAWKHVLLLRREQIQRRLNQMAKGSAELFRALDQINTEIREKHPGVPPDRWRRTIPEDHAFPHSANTYTDNQRRARIAARKERQNR